MTPGESRQLLEDARLSGNKAEEANVLYRTGNMLQDEGRFWEAITFHFQALDIAQSLDLNLLTVQVFRRLHECYHQTGQLEKAYEFSIRATEMDDFILNGQRLKAFDELGVKYRTAEKEKQLALAENKNLLQSRQLGQSRWAISLLGLGLLIVALFAHNVQQKKKVVQLIAANNQIRHEKEIGQLQLERESAAVMSLLVGQEQERRRIANELHDSLGGLLFSMKLKLSNVDGPLDDIAQMLEDAIAENRRISQNLLPATLARFGLCPALREWAGQFEKTYNLSVHLDLPGEEMKLPDETAISLFRIAQELMNNAAKHANATRLALHFYLGEEALTMLVEDDGAGFDMDGLPPGFLKTVYSRVQLLKGNVHVDSKVGKGTTVIVEVPPPATQITH